MLCGAQQPTFHSDGEGVRDGAVVVEGSTLVLAVVFQRDAVEAKPPAVAVQLAGCFIQAAVLLFPFHLWSGSAGTEIRQKREEEEEQREKDVTVRQLIDGRRWIDSERSAGN